MEPVTDGNNIVRFSKSARLPSSHRSDPLPASGRELADSLGAREARERTTLHSATPWGLPIDRRVRPMPPERLARATRDDEALNAVRQRIRDREDRPTPLELVIGVVAFWVLVAGLIAWGSM